ncbi:MAG: carboxylate--amine ligase [Gammaproteobacteria bacterium]
MVKITMDIDKKPPLLLLGGRENALAIVRSLTKKGITVNASAPEDAHVFRSRFCQDKYPIPSFVSQNDFWKELLLGDHKSTDQQANAKGEKLKGSVLFACSDDALQFLIDNRAALEKDYILDDYNPEIHTALLSKQATLELAKSVGVSTPNFWNVKTLRDLMKIEEEIIFPAIIKPIHSHLFQRQFGGKKYFRAENYDELVANATLALDKELEFMVSELIPGPDTLLSSYYTYHDKSGTPLYHYTKKVNRRHPMNSGAGCHHESEWLPETAEQGKKFFQGINFRGIGNIEFKYDTRDNQYKIIECNTRFTGGHPLLVSSGADVAHAIYNHLIGQPLPRISNDKNLGYWYPLPDIAAFLELKENGLLSFSDWIKSIITKKLVFPFFKWNDPLPSLYEWKKVFSQKLQRSKLQLTKIQSLF